MILMGHLCSVCCLKTPCCSLLHILLFQRDFIPAGHIRRTVNSRAALIPHFTLLPLVFDSTKDVLVSRSLAISASLSSAKHKFTAHSCTGWGFLLLQRGGSTTMLFCSVLWGVEWQLQRESTPHFNTELLYIHIGIGLKICFGPNINQI